jgi:alanyl-tRNA synthetase
MDGKFGLRQNFCAERLPFDFSHPRRLTPDEARAVEDLVNTQFARDLPITVEVMRLDQALAPGALAIFGDKYGEQWVGFFPAPVTDWRRKM